VSDQVFEYGGQYRLLRLLAEGGMGRVFLAEQFGSSGFSKTVAIKIIHRDLVDEKMFRELFIGEAKLTADLIHENIVQVYQLVEYKQSYGIVMEYLHGTTLDGINDRLDEINDYCPPELGAFVISRVARALAYAHTKLGREGQPMGIVHRDVSPPNILVSWQGVVKLSDFGIAKAVPMHFLDEQEHVVGKIPYQTPEQGRLEGSEPRSDIFALGLVFYEVLTGRQAYPAEDLDQLLQLQRTPPRSARAYNPAISAELEAILNKMIAFDLNDRFQTAADVVVALETYLYSDRYGPTNEKLRDYLSTLFPSIDKTTIIPRQPE